MTARALLIGLGFVVYFQAGGPGGVGGFHLAPGSLVVLFLLAAGLNPLLRRLGRRPLSPSELIVIWTMLAVALVNDLSFYLPITLVGPFYFAGRENSWASLFHRYLPRSLFLQDPHAVRWFFEGLPPGARLPWGAWLAALAPWLLFALFFYLMMFSLSLLLRAQWTERERFSFPIVQIPVEIAAAGQSESGGLFRNWFFWLGTALPVGLHGMNGLAQHFPAVPSVPLRLPLADLLQQLPWSEVQPLTLYVVFAVIGFSFLLPLEISFSFAFFFLFYKLECYAGGSYGVAMPVAPAYIARQFAQHQEIGAFLAIGAGTVSAARGHLREVWRLALHPEMDRSREETIPYRWVLIGFAISLLGMTLWLWAAGVEVLMAALCLALFVVIAVVISWAVVGGGQFFMQNSFAPLEVMMTGIGSSAIGPGSFTMLRMTQMIFMFDMRSLQMPTLLHGYRGADVFGLRRRSVVVAMAIALLAAVVVGTGVSIWYVSRHSALKLGGWGYLDAPRIPGRHIASVLRNPQGPSLADGAWVAGGALFTALLITLRARYLWFPLHPIGFAFASSYAMYTVWFSFLIGWLFKLLITRYGGLRGYLLLRPLFLGLVLGDCLMASFWSIVGAATQVEYPPFSGIA